MLRIGNVTGRDLNSMIRIDPSRLNNILMKINTKLNGLNCAVKVP